MSTRLRERLLPRTLRRRRAWSAVGLYAAVVLILLYTGFPVYWALVTSLETGSQLFTVNYWPGEPQWGNYVAIFQQQNFGRNLLNSFAVATVTVVLALGLALFAAYGLGRVRFRGRMLLLYTILGVSMFPQIAVLSGLFELVKALGLYNSWLGLALSYTMFTVPFTVWVLTVFTAAIPRELEETALVDGASAWVVIRRIFVPLLRPAMASAGLLAFLIAWNEFLFALTFTLTDRARTVPVAIALISGASAHELPYGRIMAASIVVTVPVVLLVLAFQRHIVSGLTAGAVKE